MTQTLLSLPSIIVRHLIMQTAHEPGYLVKHLLGSLPPVVDRVKLMRKGQAPNGSQEDNFAKMAQSQVKFIAQVVHYTSAELAQLTHLCSSHAACAG